MPARTGSLARSRLLTHGIHYPLRPVSRALEGAVYGDRTLFALTETGRQAIDRTYPRTRTHYVPHLVRERPAIRPAQDRPKAVGFFGLVYRGKGFEQIAAIRRHLPDDITIRVAGRGTEAAAADGRRRDPRRRRRRRARTPSSIRCGPSWCPTANGTSTPRPTPPPVWSRTPRPTGLPWCRTDYGSLAELGTETGTVVVPTYGGAEANAVATDVAAATTALLNDPAASRDARRQLRAHPPGAVGPADRRGVRRRVGRVARAAVRRGLTLSTTESGSRSYVQLGPHGGAGCTAAAASACCGRWPSSAGSASPTTACTASVSRWRPSSARRWTTRSSSGPHASPKSTSSASAPPAT